MSEIGGTVGLQVLPRPIRCGSLYLSLKPRLILISFQSNGHVSFMSQLPGSWYPQTPGTARAYWRDHESRSFSLIHGHRYQAFERFQPTLHELAASMDSLHAATRPIRHTIRYYTPYPVRITARPRYLP